MGSYSRDENNQIFSEFASRIGKIVCQYEENEFPEGEKFEVTLNLIALQSLLTQCIEQHRDRGKAESEKSILANPVTATSTTFGIHKGLIKENTFGEETFTYFKLLVHIRHALSHPTAQLETNSTGYTTTGGNPSEEIKAFRFVNAPDNGHNKGKNFCIEIPVKTIRKLVLGLSDLLTKAKTK